MNSYPKIYALGHAAVAELLLDDVTVEEKVDGSQFSFGRYGGELRCRSRGAELNVLAPDKMFARGVEVAGSLDLVDGWTYRGEYLAKPKHNALAYDRVPLNHIALFDINPSLEMYLSYGDKAKEAERIGVDVVPIIHVGRVADAQVVRGMLDRASFLGGQKIEGVVVKNYMRFGRDKHVLMGKFVSEAFKEVHGGAWREANPGPSDIVDKLIERYRTPARWQKAVQHLREVGAIVDDPRDIGPLVKAAWEDVVEECGGDIRDALFAWAEGKIRRGVTRGLPEWYKEQLLQRQFEAKDE